MKKTLIVTLLLLTLMISHVHSHPAFRPYTAGSNGPDVGFNIYGGALGGFVRVKDFKQFAESYNAFYGPGGQNILEGELGTFKLGTGYEIGASLRFGYLLISYSFVQLESHVEVGIQGGNKRHFTHVLQIPANIGFGYAGRYFYCQFKSGFATPVIECGYEYTDGTISYGRERALNGIYRGTCFSYGLDMEGRLPIGKFFALRAGVSFMAFSTGNYRDYHSNKSFMGYPDQLPIDYGTWQANPAGYDSNNYVRARGITFFAYGGVSIGIN